MDRHRFLFTPGRWVGGGKITFSASNELIRFYTSWQIENEEDGRILSKQRIEMQQVQETVNNQFIFYDFSENKFKVHLTNELFGSVEGTGIVDAKTVAWEFHGSTTRSNRFEGFEVYELQEDGDYMMHAEYASEELFRTIVDARIWQKSDGVS